jgi:diguanylate cyclase (GGDEF)-like protein
MESRLRRQACYDPLTGVLNRAEAELQLIKAVSHADRTGRCGAVIVLDIDDFKSINDTHGHLAGDTVLKDLTNRLTRVARAGDSLGRIGGDELVLILEGLENREDAVAAVHKIVGATCYQMPINGFLVPVSTSVGVAVFPEDATSAEKLLDLADRAMYAAKRRGKNGFCFAASLGGPVVSASPEPAESERR